MMNVTWNAKENFRVVIHSKCHAVRSLKMLFVELVVGRCWVVGMNVRSHVVYVIKVGCMRSALIHAREHSFAPIYAMSRALRNVHRVNNSAKIDAATANAVRNAEKCAFRAMKRAHGDAPIKHALVYAHSCVIESHVTNPAPNSFHAVIHVSVYVESLIPRCVEFAIGTSSLKSSSGLRTRKTQGL